MTKYYLTNKAVNDLTRIWNYTFEQWSEQQADNYYQMLIDCFGKIAKEPERGKNYEGLTPKLYGFKAGKHIIFYRQIKKNKIEITRILHESMDLKNRIIE